MCTLLINGEIKRHNVVLSQVEKNTMLTGSDPLLVVHHSMSVVERYRIVVRPHIYNLGAPYPDRWNTKERPQNM